MRNIRRWKLSLCIGGALGIVPVLAGLVLFAVPHSGALARFAYLLFGFGLPGLVFEALIMSMHEPHGGGTPMEMLFIVLPFNLIFYTLLIYSLIAIVAKVKRKNSSPPDGI